MLSEEMLRVIQADRQREIEAAQREHDARAGAPRRGRLRAWLDGSHPAEAVTLSASACAPLLPSGSQAGRAATDPTA